MLTQAELKSWLHYDPDTGVFTWLEQRSGIRATRNLIAGGKCGTYEYVYIWYKRYPCHRLAWLYITGEWPEGIIDHINGNGLDNRFANLRDVDFSGNQRNSKLQSNNTSGVNGVYWSPKGGKWVARIKFNRKNIHLGSFSTIEEATSVRREAEAKYGFHANHGLPLEQRRAAR